MKLVPADITNKTFSRKIYGLDTEEVYDFLRDVAEVLQSLSRSNDQLSNQLKNNEKILGDFRDREEILKKTLQTASQMSDKIKAESHREADLIIREARQRSELIIQETRESLRKSYQEIHDLKKSRMHFEAGLKSLIKAHLAMIDQGHSVVPDPQVVEPPRLKKAPPVEAHPKPTPNATP